MKIYSIKNRLRINYLYRLLFLFVTFFFFQTQISQAQQISLSNSQLTLRAAFTEIERQTDMSVDYSSEIIDVNKTVSVSRKQGPLSDIMTILLQGTGCTYTVQENHIVIIKAPVVAQQQDRKNINGTITDANGEPVIGANIVEKGTTNGTVTDANGNFSLQVENNASLTISYIGYLVQDINTAGKATFNIVLEEDTRVMDELVVIGYGTMRKSDLTGAVSSIGSKDFNKEPVQRMEQLLQGRASGVTVTNTSGLPGGSVQIRIRGANSINGGNDPLYIVDGVANSDLFRILDVNDIQSIEVLKDASSTAIYGSRGANGVVLVTTKKGNQEARNIEFESQQSWGSIAKKYEMLSAVDFANFYNEYRRNTGGADRYSSQEIAEWEKNGGTDWQDLIFRTAWTQNYKLRFSGGNRQLRYLISGNMRDAEGIMIESDLKKYSLRANIDVTALDWLTMNLDLNASHDKYAKSNNDITGRGGAIWTGLTYSPTVGLIGEDGNWIKDDVSSWQDNPYGKRVQDKDDVVTNYFGGNLRLSFDLPVDGLTFDVLGSASTLGRKSYTLASNEKLLRAGNNSAGNTANEWINMQNTNQLTYDNSFGIHGITATAVAEFTQNTYNNLNVGVNNLLTESVGYWNLGLGTVNGWGNEYSKSTLASFVGRINYRLMEKYLFTATVRRDGSSKFQGANKWGSFPSFAFAWRISDEPFIKNLNIFDQFKVRASWGITGNQAIGAYSTLGLLSRSNYGWGTDIALPGYWAENVPTPDLTWEKTYQKDIGFDLGFFNNRLTASIDLYEKDTKDLLLQKALPLYDGGGSVFTNLGHVKNKGVDISLQTVPIQTKSLTWESSVNFSFSKNKVIDMGGDEILHPSESSTAVTLIGFNPYVLKVGEPMGSIWGYTWLGLWGTDEAAEAAKYGQKPGDNKFLDKDKDHTINSNDQGIIGKGIPDYTFGWNNTVLWNNFELNLFIQGAVGADRLNLTRYGITEAISDAKFPTSREGYYNMWTPENQNTNVPNIYSTTIKTNAGSTQYLESADFVRLKNVSLGYNLPVKNKRYISGINLSVSVQNLLTISGYSGYDPEVTTSGTGDTKAGIEEGAFPLPRTYTLGLRVNF